eukprot:TRINITY_DN10900_c0_g1_i3.p1 TRINITY_DN10900_c0_g1~~TRINITY_DN10900_c0_g1_i3.p1  ORF type:complete len:620 (+),score=92.88 TRINITY_DN10900_c0_g1_i3:240-1862(+)
MERITINTESGGAGGALTYDSLKRLDNVLLKIRTRKTNDDSNLPNLVKRLPGRQLHAGVFRKSLKKFDIIVCGGTLGIFVATALCLRGLSVGVVEKQKLQGRTQEWNISRKELMELVKVGVLSESEVEEVTRVSFNPNRCGFNGKGEVWVKDILNLGVSPFYLIEVLKQRFLNLGGVILEGHGVSEICIYDDIAVVTLQNGELLHSRLVLDSMGNFSPVVSQVRSAQKPDGVCIVVGSCARGFKNNSFSDVIYSNMPVRDVGEARVQYFWEAFPAGSGPTDRTSYLFAYLNPHQKCPSIEEMLEDYWNLLPDYQGIKLEDLEILRVLFGIFPTYQDSPLQTPFDRVLQVGDASGIQSPVSFGGFGSLTRHLSRLSNGIYEAISADLLDSKNLSLLNPYMPNLSTAWLFQKAMTASQNPIMSPEFINELLAANFGCMERLGNHVMQPFLQDVIQFGPLAKTLGLVILRYPQLLPSIFIQVGLKLILEWMYHFSMLGLYTFLSSVISSSLRPWVSTLSEERRFRWNRRLEAWKYGSGLDYET